MLGMMRGGWGWLAGRASAVLLAAVGCSDESSSTPVPPPQDELPPGTVEIDPSQAPPSRVDSVEPEPPAPGPEAPDARYQTFLDALDRNFAVRCECQYAELGHPSAQVCLERMRKPEFEERCELMAFALHSDELGERYACLAQTRNVSADCIEAQGCEALAACEAEREETRRTCGAPVYADVEFSSFVDACERIDRLGRGPASACPDAVVEGEPVGLQVFEGNTTGAGDDVTLSCHWDFDNFGSPDLVVEWRAPEAATYLFSTENSAFTTQLGVLDGCGGAELGCSTSDGTIFGGATLVLPLAAEQSVFIVLEGYELTHSGYVRLNVAAVP
jgi:hypothetical protein